MTHTYRTGLSIGVCDPGDHSLPIRLTFNVYSGCAETLVSPAESAEPELLTAEVQVDGDWIAVPEWLLGLLYSDAGLRGELLESAAIDDDYEREQAADWRREQLREDRP